MKSEFAAPDFNLVLFCNNREKIMFPEFATCPLTEQKLLDEYFIENRTRLLEIAAFLDRLDRAQEQSSSPDFRTGAFLQALEVLSSSVENRTEQIQMLFSDPTTEPLELLNQKSARGAYQTV
jgi:hypothetical protein